MIDVFDKLGNKKVLLEQNDLDLVLLWEGEYHGDRTLDIGHRIENYSEIIFIMESNNPKIVAMNTIPIKYMHTGNPFIIPLISDVQCYIYKDNPSLIFVESLSSKTYYISKIYGRKIK